MNIKILWVDDEIELLKPHILFLESKGYTIESLNNGYDAIDALTEDSYDLVILDEMMPGMTGLETLPKIKEIAPTTPVVMVTKSEEENIMNKAIGSKIADYLIKPVNPNQVLLSIKKNVLRGQLESEQSSSDYRSEFGKISQLFGDARRFEDWVSIYKKIVNWDLELGSNNDKSIHEVLKFQKDEANNEFVKFIKSRYKDWYKDKSLDKPILSHTLLRNKVFPLFKDRKKVTFILIDNFRYDQWCMIRPLTYGLFDLTTEDFYCSILPTATQYARNAIFSGLTPLAIDKIMPKLWLNDNEEGGKNMYEEEFLRRQLQSLGLNQKVTFDKLVRPESGRKLLENIQKVHNADFSVIVYNFLDILSHARTDTEIMKELADNEVSFRALTRSWFEHSDLWELMKQLQSKGHTIVITSDHGTIHVDNPVKVVGDKETSANLRYKTGRNVTYSSKNIFEIEEPEKVGLPRQSISSNYIFACNSDFLVYPNNYNHFVRYYKNTFQHGGVSMEEMIVPFVVLDPK